MEQKKSIFNMKKSWQWMVYIDLALPLIMFLFGWLMGDNDMGKFFSGLFHAYNLYIMNPFFDLANKMGIVGILIPLFLFGWAIKRRDFVDLRGHRGAGGGVFLAGVELPGDPAADLFLSL